MSHTRSLGSEQHKGASETAVLLPGPAAPPLSNGGDRDITTLFQAATDTRMVPLDTKNRQCKHFQGAEGDRHGIVVWGDERNEQYNVGWGMNFTHSLDCNYGGSDGGGGKTRSPAYERHT
jgi:hypothetical protein